jgi:hypothetical protein
LEILPEFVDCPNEAAMEALARADTDGLRLPSARDVRLEIRAICGRGLDYFGSEDARRSSPVIADARAESGSEPDLFMAETPRTPYIRAIFVLPDEAPSPALAAEMAAIGKKDTRPPSVLDRIAAELNLDSKDLTLSGRIGQRVTFGCSSALKSTLAPDHGSVTFLSHNELANRWIVAIALTLNRDWTWDGLEDQPVAISRGDRSAGVIEWKRTANALARVHPDRSRTELVFLDVIDPAPEAGRFPAEVELQYRIIPQFRGALARDAAAIPLSIRLPMVTHPAQTPSLVSAGIALSPYTHDAKYSQTFPRQRMLWLEFTEPPANPRDGYFARMLACAPDPMLTGLTRAGGEAEADAVTSALPIDPEPMRVVRQGAVDDEAGLSAMQPLVPTNSPLHFLLPLPPGMSPDSPELFGMLTYEFRVGHREGWSTAHGRFGAPLVATGIQHPLPYLTCSATASAEDIRVVSGYAFAFGPGEDLRPPEPATQLWVVVYAQVKQLDGAEWRNILLGRQRAVRTPGRSSGAYGAVQWTRADLGRNLEALGLHRESPLSVIAIELMPETDTFQDPLAGNLGNVRILRASPLTPVPQVCA